MSGETFEHAEITKLFKAFLKANAPGAEEAIDNMTDDESLSSLIDSLSFIEVVDWIEQTFAVEVSPLEFVPENFNSIGSIVRFVTRSHEAS